MLFIGCSKQPTKHQEQTRTQLEMHSTQSEMKSKMVENYKYSENEMKECIRSNALIKLEQALAEEPNIIHLRDFLGQTLLFSAAKHERFDICKLFVNAGIDVNALDTRNATSTALESACRSGNIEIVTLFLESGANPNLARTCFSAINSRKPTAAKIIELMIKHGLDVNQVFLMFDDPNKRRTALDFAGSNKEVVAVLKKHGAKKAAEIE